MIKEERRGLYARASGVTLQEEHGRWFRANWLPSIKELLAHADRQEDLIRRLEATNDALRRTVMGCCRACTEGGEQRKDCGRFEFDCRRYIKRGIL